MLNNKERDMTPYPISKKPKRQCAPLLPLIWLASRVMTLRNRLRIDRSGIKGLKPPFLVLAEHHGFTDYFLLPLALMPYRASYVSDVEGFAAFDDGLYTAIGCIPTRRFTRDTALVRNIRHATHTNRDIVVVFPEARHSNVGTNSVLPASVGKLVRLLGLPVVVAHVQGSYLNSPIWDETNRRRAPLLVSLELAFTTKQIDAHTPEEITTLLNQKFGYDEYRWQAENNIRIPYANRAEGLHKMLYQCPRCMREHTMHSKENRLYCTACNKSWHMDEYGQLHALEGDTEYPHIPDWYEFERKQVHIQTSAETYQLDIPVRVDALPNHKGFVPLGTGRLCHTPAGFSLWLPDEDNPHIFASVGMASVHTEYDYRGRGDCVVLSTPGCCYYLYPQSSDVSVTKIQFAAERFFTLAQKP